MHLVLARLLRTPPLARHAAQGAAMCGKAERVQALSAVCWCAPPAELPRAVLYYGCAVVVVEWAGARGPALGGSVGTDGLAGTHSRHIIDDHEL